jgi:hypothetical protein
VQRRPAWTRSESGQVWARIAPTLKDWRDRHARLRVMRQVSREVDEVDRQRHTQRQHRENWSLKGRGMGGFILVYLNSDLASAEAGVRDKPLFLRRGGLIEQRSARESVPAAARELPKKSGARGAWISVPRRHTTARRVAGEEPMIPWGITA